MTAVSALSPLRIVPVPRPRLEPAPLPGEPFPDDAPSGDYVQALLSFDAGEQTTRLPTPQVLPDLVDIIRPLATALVEVLAGRRPVVQLVRWTSPAVYAALTARASVAYRRELAHPRGPVRVAVRRVMLSQPCDDVAEAALVVIDGTRVRAIAIQLRSDSGRWSIEALHVG